MKTETSPAPANPETEWSRDRLDALGCREIVDLFKTLEAPEFSEMDGEFPAKVLDQGSPLANRIAHWTTTHNPITGRRWLTKSFTPETAMEGHGYNSFEQGGKTLRIYRMKTTLAPSRYDGKPAFQLDYGAYRSMLGKIHMVDEVRKLREGLYLGIGTWGFTQRARMRPLPFVLEGPARPFVGADGLGKKRR